MEADFNQDDYRDEPDFDDRELPDESDMDQDQGDEYAETIPCPWCRKTIYEQSEFCPHCGKYISAEDTPHRKPLWLIIAVAVLLLITLLTILH